MPIPTNPTISYSAAIHASECEWVIFGEFCFFYNCPFTATEIPSDCFGAFYSCRGPYKIPKKINYIIGGIWHNFLKEFSIVWYEDKKSWFVLQEMNTWGIVFLLLDRYKSMGLIPRNLYVSSCCYKGTREK